MWNEDNRLGKKLQEMTERSRQLLEHFQVGKPRSQKTYGSLATNERRLECLSRVYDISRIKKTGSTFVLTGKIPEESDWIRICFEISDTDKALLVSIRQNEKVTVFNNMKSNVWCYEEREHWFPFRRGHVYTFTFHIQNNGTMVTVNDEFFYYFKHRMDIEKVTRLATNLDYEHNSYYVVDREVLTLMPCPTNEVPAQIMQSKETAVPEKPEEQETVDEKDDGIEDTFEIIDNDFGSDENLKSLEMNENSLTEKQNLQDSNEIFQEISKLVKKYGSSLVEKQFKAVVLRDDKDVTGRYDQPLMEHKLPNPKKHFQVYVSELENGFEPGSMFVFKCIMESGCCVVLRKSQNNTCSETEIKFEPSTNQIIMRKYDEINKSTKIKDVTLFSGEEAEVTIKRHEKGIQVYVNNTSCEFFDEQDLGRFDVIEISSHGLSNVAYFTKKYYKPQEKLQKLICINRSCSLKYIPKLGKRFILTGKMPVHRDWMHINFDISDPEIAVHMSVRQNDRVVVFNNKKNNKWRSEERIYTFPFVRGQTYTFTFDIKFAGTQVSVDGSPFYFFKHRVDPEKITRLRSDLEESHDFCYTVCESAE